jgi:hypothetical protein
VYLEKRRQIEELRRQREVEVERQGKAMRDAEEREGERLRGELERLKKEEEDHRRKMDRGR